MAFPAGMAGFSRVLEQEIPMRKLNMRMLIVFMASSASLCLASRAVVAEGKTDDDFWSDQEFFKDDDLFEATGSGGGPSLTWFDVDFSSVNRVLEGLDDPLPAIPDVKLYWGGAGWGGMRTGARSFVAIGGGGFGGGSEAQVGGKRTQWSHSAGYFALKGIYALHPRLFAEAGLQIGGGNSHIWAETREADGDVLVKVRGARNFVLLRPELGLDIRLARWVGVLVEGGYSLSSGSWSLDGNTDLLAQLDMGKNDGLYATVLLRFGI